MSRESEVVAMFQNKEHPLSVAEIAARIGVSRPTIYLILKRQDVALKTTPAARPVAPHRQAVLKKGGILSIPAHITDSGKAIRASAGRVARFVAPKSTPEDSFGLRADHPAVLDGRTLFPSRVKAPAARRRLLISGKNNPKTGGRVEKGPWAGMPIYTLSLEERRTCPRSCAQWGMCYGNTMPAPERTDAFDPDFFRILTLEAVALAREHRQGFVVRLHILGDFFSPEYVLLWGALLDRLPGLHVFGYTARRMDADDAQSRRTAAAIEALRARWSRFAIRTSHTEPGRARAIVVESDPQRSDVRICPAQTGGTAACSTCGLCWSPAFIDTTIAFIRHGMKRARHSRREA